MRRAVRMVAACLIAAGSFAATWILLDPVAGVRSDLALTLAGVVLGVISIVLGPIAASPAHPPVVQTSFPSPPAKEEASAEGPTGAPTMEVVPPWWRRHPVGVLAAAGGGAAFTGLLMTLLAISVALESLHAANRLATATVLVMIAPLGCLVAGTLHIFRRWLPGLLLGLVGAAAVLAGTVIGAFAVAPDTVRPEGTSKIMLAFAAGAGAAAILAFALALPERGRIIALTLVVAVILSLGAPLGLAYRQYWIGFDSQNVAVFHGRPGLKLLPRSGGLTRAEVPAAFRAVLDDGVPVAGLADGLRLVRLLPAIYDRPELAEGYDSGFGRIYPPLSCGGTGGADSPECAAPHQVQAYSAVVAPFERFPGAKIMTAYADELCARKLNARTGGLGPVGAHLPVERDAGGDFRWYSAAWSPDRWNEGNHEIGCFFTAGDWSLTGSLPGVWLRLTDAYPWRPRWGAAAGGFYSKAVNLLEEMPFPQADVDVTVKAAVRSGATAGYGVACRFRRSTSDTYVLALDTAGTYSIEKQIAGTVTTLVNGKIAAMSPSYHEVRGVCVQARPGAAVTLTLYADGTRIATVTDTQAPLDDGNIGLFVNGDVNFGQVDCILSGARSTNDSTAPRRFGHPRS